MKTLFKLSGEAGRFGFKSVLHVDMDLISAVR